MINMCINIRIMFTNNLSIKIQLVISNLKQLGFKKSGDARREYKKKQQDTPRFKIQQDTATLRYSTILPGTARYSNKQKNRARRMHLERAEHNKIQ